MDANSTLNEKTNIKNLLFTKSVPNYTIPIPTDGYKVFSCTDCGDRFILESSYEIHTSRKSFKITYFCRNCNEVKIFFNRCNLLSHIRSHAFKTATINVCDIKVEPLPLSFFNINSISMNDATVQEKRSVICFDCKKDITITGISYKDRAKHYTVYTNKAYKCPVCLLTLSTKCAWKAHMRIHLVESPFYCPECGIHLSNKTIIYPYNHHCEGFNMMRATARIGCPLQISHVFHPNDFQKHLKSKHLKKVYKCPSCMIACYKKVNMFKHFKSHRQNLIPVEFFQCEWCPGRLIMHNQIDKHLKVHTNIDNADKKYFVYPCWICDAVFTVARNLIRHQISKHENDNLKDLYNTDPHGASKIISPNVRERSILRTVKTCKNCNRQFNHRCNDGSFVTNECPYKCTVRCSALIMCHICKCKVSQDWYSIKKHYAICHKDHKCLDINITLQKLDIQTLQKNANILNKNKNDNQQKIKNDSAIAPTTDNIQNISDINSVNCFICKKCGEVYESKEILEIHMVTHRDPYMAYQCMECAESFIVKSSFSTHLLIKHGIIDVNNYIEQKQCYNENALHTLLDNSNNEPEEPLKENQCKICREEFNNSIDFEKHFRVHGMAFLMKNTSKNVSP